MTGGDILTIINSAFFILGGVTVFMSELFPNGMC